MAHGLLKILQLRPIFVEPLHFSGKKDDFDGGAKEWRRSCRKKIMKRTNLKFASALSFELLTQWV